MPKPQLNKLYLALRDAHLAACLAGDCDCITSDQHARNVQRARELGLADKPQEVKEGK